MKKEKGFTLIELTISIVAFVLFASVVANLNYQIFSNSIESKRTALATEKTVEILEYVGSIDIESDGFNDNGNIDSSNNIILSKIKNKFSDGASLLGNTISFNLDNDIYECQIIFEDYANLPKNAGKDIEVNILKIVTVNVSFYIRGNGETISIQRVLTK